MVEEEKEAEISAQGSCGAEEGSLTSQRKKKRRRDRVRLQEGSRIREPGTGDPESEPFTNNDTQAPGSKPSVTMLGIGSAFDLVRKVSDKMSSKKQGEKMINVARLVCVLRKLPSLSCVSQVARMQMRKDTPEQCNKKE